MAQQHQPCIKVKKKARIQDETEQAAYVLNYQCFRNKGQSQSVRCNQNTVLPGLDGAPSPASTEKSGGCIELLLCLRPE